MAGEKDEAVNLKQILELSRELIDLQRQVESVHRTLSQKIREMQTRLAAIEKSVHKNS